MEISLQTAAEMEQTTMAPSQEHRLRPRRPINHRRSRRHSARSRIRSSSLTILVQTVTLLSIAILPALLLLLPAVVSAHGYLKSPRARNLVAYQDMNYKTPDSDDPKPEDCPYCLNRGGKLAQCGILYGMHEDVPWERNYDQPLNILNEPMRSNLQGVYKEGAEIEVEVLVTTHHKGHFVFSVCPIEDTVPMSIPTEECFKQNKLKFISDELYGAPPDPNYPERAYIAPASKVEYMMPLPGEQPVVGAYYKMKFQLPMGVAGNVVLLQWYYLTANSCKHEGYADYPFPEDWGSDVTLYPGLPDCGEVPPDGNGVPEQFWNCAEIRVIGKGGYSDPGPAIDIEETMVSMEAAAAAVAGTQTPTPKPTPAPMVPKLYYPNYGASTCLSDGLQAVWIASSNIFDNLQDCCEHHFWNYDNCLKNSPNSGHSANTNNIASTAANGEALYVACKNTASIYYEATDDCAGYYLCNMGTQGEVIECAGNDMLYDEGDQMCNWANEVTCTGRDKIESPFDEFGNPRPTTSPTHAPTGKSNELLAWDPDAVDRGHSKTIIGYYASWQWYDRMNLAEPKNFDFSKITRANFAFFQITPEGDIYGTDMWADPITLFGFYD